MIGNPVTDAETQAQQEAVLKRLTEIADQQSYSESLPYSSAPSREGTQSIWNANLQISIALPPFLQHSQSKHAFAKEEHRV